MPTFLTSDGLNLHYSDEGDGVPVICLSGLTRNGDDFEYVTPHLHDTRLIKLDYRGRGKSDWAKDYLTYSVPREAQDVIELMDHLGLQKSAFIGTSRGGLISMTLTAMIRERMLGVVLVDIGPVLDMGGLNVIMDYLGNNPVWNTWAEATSQRHTVMAGFANVPDSRWRSEVEHLYHQTAQGLVINYDPALKNAVLEAGTHEVPDLWPYYEALSGHPVAVIHGANSDLLSAETVAEMGQRIPDAIIATVPDRGHIPFLDEPEAVTAIRAWVERIK